VTARPRSAFASRLAGVNLLRGRADGDVVVLDDGTTVYAAGAGSGDVFLVVHPTAIALHRTHPEGTPRNVWHAELDGLEPHEGRVRVRLRGTPALVAEVTPRAVADLRLDEGGAVWASVKATEIVRYPA
jgi:molybdate transport system ATP-binding protein